MSKKTKTKTAIEILSALPSTVARLKEEREINRADLAKASGLSYRAIQELESGARAGYRMATFAALCDGFEMTPEKMLAELRKDA